MYSIAQIHTDHLELDTLDLGCDADDSQISTLPRPANVQNRLKRYLGLFAAIKNGKGLHEQRRLVGGNAQESSSPELRLLEALRSTLVEDAVVEAAQLHLS